jgi:polysaccharide biosynthesis protein PslG
VAAALLVAALAALLVPVADGAKGRKKKVHLGRAYFGMIAGNIDAYQSPAPLALWNRELKGMSNAGVGTFRQTFQAQLPLTTVDQFVLTAAQHKIVVLPVILDGSGYDPNPGPNHGFHPPKNLKKFAGYARSLVKRYGPKGSLWKGHGRLRKYAIRSWQIWNEPNLAVWWKPKPNPKAYARMVKTVGKAIRKADRKATIISAGIPDSSQSKPLGYKKYLAKFLRAGGAKNINAIGVNAYSRNLKGVQKILFTYRSLLARNKGGKVKMLISELGWADKGHKNPQVVGRKGQASRVRAMFKLVAKQRKKLKLIGLTYFDWKDYAVQKGDPKGDTWGYHTGLLTAKGKRKPAYRAFQRGVKSLR